MNTRLESALPPSVKRLPFDGLQGEIRLMNEKTLYLSDLDGTLLGSNVALSDYTSQTIRDLTERGMLFSYATARSYVTASKVTKGFDARIPLIVYNGAMVVDNVTGEILISNFFGAEVFALLDDLLEQGIVPIVYAFQEGKEKFSYFYDRSSKGMRAFLDSRRGDPRENPITDLRACYRGDIFYVTCIDAPEKLEPFYKKYAGSFRCIYQKDLYTGEQWLEFMPQGASKANAARQLKEYLGCSRIVAFGDGLNDLDLFRLADECYAVSNAETALKAAATAVIGSNDEDAVARWLNQTVTRQYP